MFILSITETHPFGERMPRWVRSRKGQFIIVTKVYIAIIENASSKVYNDYMRFCTF